MVLDATPGKLRPDRYDSNRSIEYTLDGYTKNECKSRKVCIQLCSFSSKVQKLQRIFKFKKKLFASVGRVNQEHLSTMIIMD